MSLNREADVGMLLQEACIGLNSGLIAGANIRLVIVKVDVLHVLREQLFIAHRSLCRRRWRRRRIYRYPSGCGLSSAIALGSQCVRGRVSWAHLLRPTRLYGAYALIDADVRCIRGLPRQRGRTTFIYRVGARG